MAGKLWVGTRKGLFLFRRGLHSWTLEASHFLGMPVSAVLPDPRDGAVYAALRHGHFGPKLHRADDGKSFREVASPTYPADLADRPAVEELWALEAGHPSQPGVLWVGTIPGGLFRSSDRGESWSLVRSLWEHEKRKEWFGGGTSSPGLHSIAVDPRDARRVWVAVSCGGVWLSEDGGERFGLRTEGMRADYMPAERRFDPAIQDPHRLVLCPAAPEHLWVQHHNGIYTSKNGGQSWRELSARPSTFGFAVAVHPANPQVAWFVPAESDQRRIPVGGRVVVNRTRDGGDTFETLTRGLPQEHAYDLCYRHALDVEATGQSLCFGSTTGSLWLSDDQGDSWWALSAHLPPIYCVRFG